MREGALQGIRPSAQTAQPFSWDGLAECSHTAALASMSTVTSNSARMRMNAALQCNLHAVPRQSAAAGGDVRYLLRWLSH